ncbi:PTS sugar transporter subunit IIA [Xylanimonas ulmi]|uniref:PTS system N-acetylglucosamine-specific IIA component n=1 Tax=Xylanimonas ulmi TaxID=228973 RepID=A0A4Q7M4W6_9MICO|nr:glucose PTS transporter subunit IIA [Xylanibacterium ulmi]RZS62063.1 PTS system N-acetylglucosamine-specific IIA component [Xylanibacterium ulmi]
MVTVLAPVAGTVRALGDVPDPVFSAGLVGPGVAIDPSPEAGREAVSPVAGTIVKLHPHAFVVSEPGGRAVLVHLGIDTVQLEGEGFTLHVAEGDVVAAGQPVVTWDPAAVAAGGRSAVVPVVALDVGADGAAVLPAVGASVAAGEALLEVPAAAA